MPEQLNPEDFIITRKRKKYRFAHFANYANCYELDEWKKAYTGIVPAGKQLIVEVGAGTGLFGVELARRSPDAFVVCIDAKGDRLQKGAGLALKTGVANIVFLRAHAARLEELFAKSCIDELWLTFSDPFPKTRHAKHRLTHSSFLKSYRRLLSSSGQLNMKTDNLGLFHWSLERLVSARANLSFLSFDVHAQNSPEAYSILTTFEEKFLALGLPIYAVRVSFPELGSQPSIERSGAKS